MDVTLEDAYAEACRALGESIVTQRLLSAEVHRLATENQALRREAAAPAT